MDVKLTITPESNVDAVAMRVIDNSNITLVEKPRLEIVPVRDRKLGADYTLPACKLNWREHLVVINGIHHRILHMLS